MAKGGQFERDMAKVISLWFSRGKDDDLLGRSSQSGGRATVRRRKGKGTKHCGDLAATCTAGEPLTKLLTWELKKGYNTDTIFNLFDRPKACGKTWFKWFDQATEAARNAGTPYWCVIHRRDHRDPIIALPDGFVEALIGLGCYFPIGMTLGPVIILRLETFFQSVDPQDVNVLLRSNQ